MHYQLLEKLLENVQLFTGRRRICFRRCRRIIGSKSLDHDRRERGVRDFLDRLVSLVRLSELSLPTTQTVSY
jgi:hypothetical protein